MGRRTFSKEFKIEAVRLVRDRGQLISLAGAQICEFLIAT